MTSRGVGFRLLVVALAAMASLSLSAGTNAPRVTVDRSEASPGDDVTVTGGGWQPGTIVVIDVCGNNALDGAPDCSPSSTSNVGVQPDGTFSTLLRVTEPPTPCPCVIQVSSTSNTAMTRTALTIRGARVMPPTERWSPPDISRQLEIRQARLTDASLLGPLGFPPERTLELSVANIGTVDLEDIPVAVTAGRGDTPLGYVEGADIGAIGAGEVVEVEIPVTFDPLVFGTLTVRGSLLGGGEEVTFLARTSNPPVLPIVIAIVVAQIFLLRIRNRLRRRVEEDFIDERDGVPPMSTSDLTPQNGSGGAIDLRDLPALDLTDPPMADQIDSSSGQEASEAVDSLSGLVRDVRQEADRVLVDHRERARTITERLQRATDVEVEVMRLEAAAERRAVEAFLSDLRTEADAYIASVDERTSTMLRSAMEIEQRASHTLDRARASAAKIVAQAEQKAAAIASRASELERAAFERCASAMFEHEAPVATGESVAERLRDRVDAVDRLLERSAERLHAEADRLIAHSLDGTSVRIDALGRSTDRSMLQAVSPTKSTARRASEPRPFVRGQHEASAGMASD